MYVTAAKLPINPEYLNYTVKTAGTYYIRVHQYLYYPGMPYYFRIKINGVQTFEYYNIVAEPQNAIGVQPFGVQSFPDGGGFCRIRLTYTDQKGYPIYLV